MTEHHAAARHERASGPATAPDVLVVCTANVARSPLLAARLQSEADQRLGPGRAVVTSAGTEARFGDPAASGSCAVAARWETSLDAHTSKSVAYVGLRAVPLTIVMARTHRRALVAREPALDAGSFTALELVACLERLASEHRLPAPPAPGTDRSALREHLSQVARLADEVRPTPRWWSRRSLDIPDPIGAGQATFDQLGERFAEMSEILGKALFGPSRS